MTLARILRHLAIPDWVAHRAFPAATLQRIQASIRASERLHEGELRFALEGGLDLAPLLRGLSPRGRALEWFSRLRVWDTERNSGVLIYLQLVDRDIEIVADRGINARVAQLQWDAICRRMEDAFRAGRFEEGVLAGIHEITALLKAHFPAGSGNADELPDRPVVL
jgi:uncharacterized membrane protein